MNLFSVGLCAPLMNEALLYTAPPPLQTHLQGGKADGDTQYMSVTCGGNEVCYTNHPSALQPHYTYLPAETCCNKTSRHIKKHKDEIMACVVFKLIPMGN